MSCCFESIYIEKKYRNRGLSIQYRYLLLDDKTQTSLRYTLSYLYLWFWANKWMNEWKLKTLVINWWYACAVQRSHSDEAGADTVTVQVKYCQWCGLRPSDLGQTGLRPKKSVLVLQFWCCFVKRDLVTLVVIILKDTATFKYYL